MKGFRNYSVIDYPIKQKELFEFLITDYGFKLTEELDADFSYISEYKKKGIRIHLDYDHKDNFFYFKLIRGDDTKFPNDQDTENIKTFLELFQKYVPNLDVYKLLPDDKQYLKSLERNAILLRKYGDKVLRGEEWF